MTCQGTASLVTNYKVTLSCPAAPVLVPTLTQQPVAFLALENSDSEPVSAALISPGAVAGAQMNFIFNDYNQATGSSTTSDAAVHHIHIILTRTTGETILRLEKNPDLGIVPELSGHAFTIYYRIESPHLQPSQIDSALVEFSVKENLLASLGLKPEDVVLMHWDGTRWTELPTRFDYSSKGRAYFSATTPGFSYFVITNKVVSRAVQTRTTLPLTVLPSMSSLPEITSAAGSVPRDTLPAASMDSPAAQKNPALKDNVVRASGPWCP
jgi:PGF-pre-PGF domain-containing protein